MAYNTRASRRQAAQAPNPGRVIKTNKSTTNDACHRKTKGVSEEPTLEVPFENIMSNDSQSLTLIETVQSETHEPHHEDYVESNRLRDLSPDDSDRHAPSAEAESAAFHDHQLAQPSVQSSKRSWQSMDDETTSEDDEERLPETQSMKRPRLNLPSQETMQTFEEDEGYSSQPLSSSFSDRHVPTLRQINKPATPRPSSYLIQTRVRWPPPMAYYSLPETEGFDKDNIRSQASYNPNVIMATRALVQHERKHGPEAVPTEESISTWLEENRDDFIRSHRNTQTSPLAISPPAVSRIGNGARPTNTTDQRQIMPPEDQPQTGLARLAVDTCNRYAKRVSARFAGLFASFGAGNGQPEVQNEFTSHQCKPESDKGPGNKLENKTEMDEHRPGHKFESRAYWEDDKHDDSFEGLSEQELACSLDKSYHEGADLLDIQTRNKRIDDAGFDIKNESDGAFGASHSRNSQNPFREISGDLILRAPDRDINGLATPGTFALRYDDWSPSVSGGSAGSPVLNAYQIQLEERRNSLRRKIEAIGSPKKVPSPAVRRRRSNLGTSEWVDNGEPEMMDWDYDF